MGCNSVGIIGSGIMGSGIAETVIESGYPVLLGSDAPFKKFDSIVQVGEKQGIYYEARLILDYNRLFVARERESCRCLNRVLGYGQSFDDFDQLHHLRRVEKMDPAYFVRP